MTWSKAKKDPAYGKAKWRRRRLETLQRANWRCELRLPGICRGAATEVDHIYGLAADPDHQYLRAVCHPCHNKHTGQQSAAARTRSNGDPAHSPRTTWRAPNPPSPPLSW